jgi:hypothetical protein
MVEGFDVFGCTSILLESVVGRVIWDYTSRPLL